MMIRVEERWFSKKIWLRGCVVASRSQQEVPDEIWQTLRSVAEMTIIITVYSYFLIGKQDAR
jgi:hypothetical protein